MCFNIIVTMSEVKTAIAPQPPLLEQFQPYLSFHPHERHRCITIEDFTAASVLRSHADPNFLRNPVTPEMLWELRENSQLYLDSKTPVDEPDNADVAYGLQVSENLLVYFYLYYETDIYPCCGAIPCDCCFKKWAHLGDVKFVVVELENPPPPPEVNPVKRHLKRVYFGAHGSLAGEWVPADQCSIADETHVVAFPALGDHSHYKKEGLFCRIWGLVWDKTSRNRLSRPQLIPIPATPQSPGFDAVRHGWVHFAGHFSATGIDFPAHQGFYSGELPSTSNNWFRRCFCPSYW